LFKNLPDGSFVPVRVRKIWPLGDGTTATDLVVIW
jgi:hypothetical protein